MKLKPTRVLGESPFSKVLRCENSQWAIKYHAHCPSDGPVDSILIEMYFLQLLATELPDVSHTPLYMSSGHEFVFSSRLKSPRIGTVCPNWSAGRFVRPVVRFMVTQRVGQSIHEVLHRSTRLGLGNVVEMGIRMFQLIRMIHSKELIHGDVHVGNFAFRNSSSDSPESLILIDFGRSRIAPGGVFELRTELRCHRFLSPWEMTERTPPSYRDDAFRVAITMISMLYGEQFLDDITKELCERMNTKTVYWAILMEINLFGYWWVQPTSAEQKTLIDSLGTVLDIIRETTYLDVPNYGSIIDALERVLLAVARDS
jgi:serine/threonine protein kinase